jgi:hypothetical protein
MLRAGALGVALAVLAAACALAEPPPPAGTRVVQAQVESDWPQPITPVVKTPAGTMQGAVQPATLPPRSTTTMTFYVPITGEWSVTFNPGVEIGGIDLDRNYNRGSKGGCTIPSIIIGDDGSYGQGCAR